MNDKKVIRWKQRFINFEKSFKLLERTLSIPTPSEAEKGGIIQFYEVCFELSWKTVKDYLESEGFLVKSPKQVIKQAFQIEIIEDGELWLSALDDRNLTTHIYDEAIYDKSFTLIRESLAEFPEIEKAVIFGSRAMGNYKKGSDIDIVICGENVNHNTTSRLHGKLNEELPVPYFVDIINYNSINLKELKEHIENSGKIIYEKNSDHLK